MCVEVVEGGRWCSIFRPPYLPKSNLVFAKSLSLAVRLLLDLKYFKVFHNFCVASKFSFCKIAKFWWLEVG